jgi:hypothetical protein
VRKNAGASVNPCGKLGGSKSPEASSVYREGGTRLKMPRTCGLCTPTAHPLDGPLLLESILRICLSFAVMSDGRCIFPPPFILVSSKGYRLRRPIALIKSDYHERDRGVSEDQERPPG